MSLESSNVDWQDACEAGSAVWAPAVQAATKAAVIDAVLTCYGRELTEEQVAVLANRDAAAF